MFLDFHGESIQELKVNEHLVPLSSINFNKHRIYFPSDFLLVGATNYVSVKFTNSYVDNSAGLQKYLDPKDNEIYIYSHLEPYFCNRWFPCFDQPSLRASLK